MQKHNDINLIDARPDLLAAISILAIIAGIGIADDYGQPAIGLFVVFAGIILLFVSAFAYNRKRGQS